LIPLVGVDPSVSPVIFKTKLDGKVAGAAILSGEK
jgi:hypothetical protein